MPPKVFSSVKDAWRGLLSGEVVPSSRRRVSCLDTPHGSGKATEEETTFEYTVSVRLANDDGDNDEKVDVSNLSDEDLLRLKQEDPFLYYSIPSVRRRSFRFENDVSAVAPRTSSRRSSLPEEVLAGADISRYHQRNVLACPRERRTAPSEPQEHMVRRGRRFSTEAHPTLVCDELMKQILELDALGDDDLAGDLGVLATDLDI